jgi:hypothetical protein
VIAGILRNICKYDTYTRFMEVQHVNFEQVKIKFYAFRLRGSWKSYQWKLNSEVHKLMISIQTAHDKLGSQDENSREHILRSLMVIKWN